MNSVFTHKPFPHQACDIELSIQTLNLNADITDNDRAPVGLSLSVTKVNEIANEELAQVTLITLRKVSRDRGRSRVGRGADQYHERLGQKWGEGNILTNENAETFSENYITI